MNYSKFFDTFQAFYFIQLLPDRHLLIWITGKKEGKLQEQKLDHATTIRNVLFLHLGLVVEDKAEKPICFGEQHSHAFALPPPLVAAVIGQGII